MTLQITTFINSGKDLPDTISLLSYAMETGGSYAKAWTQTIKAQSAILNIDSNKTIPNLPFNYADALKLLDFDEFVTILTLVEAESYMSAFNTETNAHLDSIYHHFFDFGNPIEASSEILAVIPNQKGISQKFLISYRTRIFPLPPMKDSNNDRTNRLD